MPVVLRTTWRCLPLALLLLSLLSGCAQERNCALVPITEVPLYEHNNLLMVPAAVDGKPVTLLVDTGAERTILTEDAARRLQLPPDGHQTRSVGIGGFSANLDVQVPGIVLGHTRFPLDRLAVGRFNIDGPGIHVDGLLGADILLAFELDLDIPNHRLMLYRLRQCPGARPPWPAVQIDGVGARRDRMLLPIALNGVGGMAVLDTGAQSTAISQDLAERAGVTPQALAADPRVMVHGAAPQPIALPVHQFQALRIGPETIDKPRIAVVPQVGGLGDGLIGADFVHGRRIWLSLATRELFIAAPPPVEDSAR